MTEEHAHDPRYDLTREAVEALDAATNGPDGLGPDAAFACNIAPTDHVHARRVGAPGSGYEGRVMVLIHTRTGPSWVYIAAPQARCLAAHLLNAADDLDGATPLVFHPRVAVADEDLDDPAVSADVEPDEIEVGYEDEAPEADEDDGFPVVTPAQTPVVPALVLGLAALPVIAAVRRWLRAELRKTSA